MCVCVNICIYVCMYMCVYVCVNFFCFCEPTVLPG